MTDEIEIIKLNTQTMLTQQPGSLVFIVNNVEVMRFEPDGKILIRGEEIDDNKVVYEEVKAFMRCCNNERTRSVLDEIADSFDREADASSLARSDERFDEAMRRVDQARAAATYVRCVRDTRFPVK